MEATTQDEKARVGQVQVGSTFRHYKGKEYKILQVGRLESSMELCVVYEGLYECGSFGSHPIWIRALDNYLQHVEIDGVMVPRFEQVADG